MKKRTAKSIAADLLKVRKQVMKAHEAMTNAERYLAYSIEAHAKLPADLIEAEQELRTAEDRSTEANAELTKPLDSYSYETKYLGYRKPTGPRRYASEVAQKAWDAERQAEWARERLEHLQNEATKSLDVYTADDRERLEFATAEFNSACAIRDNLVALFAKTTGHEPTFEECERLTAKTPKAEAPEMIEIRARVLETGYVVIAENIAAALKGVSEFSINGVMYAARTVFEWAKLETGQLTIALDADTITMKSDTARATIKAAKYQKPAPALQFVSI